MATTAIVVSAANDQGQQTDYYYDRGTWYQKQGDVYIAIAAPIGSVITDLPDGCETVTVSGKRFADASGFRCRFGLEEIFGSVRR